MRVLCKLSKSGILRLNSIVHVAMETTKTCSSISFISYFSLVSCNLSLVMIWQMTYTHKLPKLCSATLNGRQRRSYKKHNISLRLVLFFLFRCFFAGSLQFSLSTVKQTKLFHSISEMFSTFLTRKTLRQKLLSFNVCEAALQAARKGGNFGAKLTHLCGF